MSPSIGLDPLTQRCIEKQRLLKDLGQSLKQLALEALVACPQLMDNLRRRLKQLEKRDGDEYRIECIHEPSFEQRQLDPLGEQMEVEESDDEEIEEKEEKKQR